MQSFFKVLAIGSVFLSFSAESATPYSVPVEPITCHALDFNSYHRAQSGKTNILSLKPDVSKPNFGGRYLLLKNELLFETLWLIADCKTGQFFHEMLSGQAEYKPDSLLLVLKSESKSANPPAPQQMVWSPEKEEWITLRAPEPGQSIMAQGTAPAEAGGIASSSTTPAPSNVLTGYEALFLKYPAVQSAPNTNCKELDYSSYHRADSGKSNIKKNNPKRDLSNFAGSFLVLKNELMFENLWLIADCASGKFFPFMLSGSAQFRFNSSLLILNHSGKPPELFLWRDQKWVQIPDPVQPQKIRIKNTMTGAEAKILFEAIPNPDRKRVSKFESLTCKALPTGQLASCEISIESKPAVPLSAQSLKEILPVLNRWGSELKIQKGLCSIERSEPFCDIEIE